MGENIDESRKILPHEITVNGDGIFIQLNGQWIPIEILQEKNGFTIKPLYEEISYFFIWKCDCGAWNFASDDVCNDCARGRYDYTPR